MTTRLFFLVQRPAGWLLLLLGVLLGGWPLRAAATHIVGGQFDLRPVDPGRNLYELRMVLYFDVLNGSPNARDPEVQVGIYEKGTNVAVETLFLPKTSTRSVAYLNPLCDRTTQLKTDEIIYSAQLTLAPDQYNHPAGYYAAWERCCRNNIISNIEAPGAAGSVFYLEFPAVTRAGRAFVNSSPTNFPPITDYACVGSEYRAPFGGTDPDGDSLRYELVTPLNGHSTAPEPLPAPSPAPYSPITWKPNYDAAHQISGATPLTVNPLTGELTVVPDSAGLFVFGVRCVEYRDGVVIGEVRRDFQLRVLNCEVSSPFSTDVFQPDSLQGLLPYVPGTVFRLPDPPGERCMVLEFTDSVSVQQLTLRLVPDPANPPINGTTPLLTVTTGRVGPGLRLRTQLCFDECFGTDGLPRTYQLILADNACPLPHRDTATVIVQARRLPNTPTRVAVEAPVVTTTHQVYQGDTLRVKVRGHDPDLNSAVTVEGLRLQQAPLRGLGITCPKQAGLNDAETTLTWPVACDVAPGQYTIYLRATGSTECGLATTADTLLRVQVLAFADTIVVIPPNVFTPNGDQLNDDFAPAAQVPARCGQVFEHVRIFNRWGRQVWESTVQDARWNGGNLPAGLYFYSLQYTDRRYRGWVQIIR